MSSRWLRSIPWESLGSTWNNNFWKKAYALWLRYVMDFTYQSDNCGSGHSFTSTEKSGTAGVFAGSTLSFTDSSAPFAADDTGKYLIIKDNTNPENGGIYQIRRYVSTTEVVIDFACGHGEYPTAATGLSWWICGLTYELPVSGEYIRLQSRHTSGWAIELAIGGWAYYQLSFRIAITGNWSGKIIGNFSGDILGDSRYYNGLCNYSGNGSGRQSFWAEGDYDGNWLHLWQHSTDSGTWSQKAAVHLISVEFVTPVSEGHVADELIVLRGLQPGIVGSQDAGTREYNSDRGRGRSWSALVNGEVTGYFMDYTYTGAGNNFCVWPNNPGGREKNWRRDGKLEAFRGTFYIIDENNINGQYHVLGYLNGHWSIPMFRTVPHSDMRYDLESRAAIKMVPLDMNGDRDVMCVVDGIVVPWCGLSVRLF